MRRSHKGRPSDAGEHSSLVPLPDAVLTRAERAKEGAKLKEVQPLEAKRKKKAEGTVVIMYI